ncbi:MAG: PLP-dependent aminotransferase family protein [Parvibaculaceae bacterium]
MSISTLSRDKGHEIWLPDYQGRSGRLYVAIADALADDIAKGRLKPGERLPTHRELAWRLKLSVSTISKAYALAERRHLVAGEVGRGTFVIPRPTDLSSVEPNRAQSDVIDLSFNCPVIFPEHRQAIALALRTITESGRIENLIPYHRDWLGLPEHRAAAGRWLSHLGVAAEVDDIVLVNGAQQAAAAILSALTEPGDAIGLEELTDPGIRFLAANRHLKIRSLPIDEDGVVPGSFETACREGSLRLAFLIPTHHSPTLAVMPEERRREIGEIAARYNVTVIENDVYGSLVDPPSTPLASFAPEHCFYLTSHSKILAPGLRIGFIAAPPGRAKDLIPGLAATTWMASLVPAEIASHLIENGSAARLAAQQRQELQRRQAMAAEILEGQQFRSLSTGFHVWLTLPEHWRAESFVAALKVRGVAVTPAEAFIVGQGSSAHAVRISLGGATQSRTELRRGLETIAEVLREKRSAASFLVL